MWGWECAHSCADLGWGFAPWVSGFTTCVLFLILACKQSEKNCKLGTATRYKQKKGEMCWPKPSSMLNVYWVYISQIKHIAFLFNIALKIISTFIFTTKTIALNWKLCRTALNMKIQLKKLQNKNVKCIKIQFVNFANKFVLFIFTYFSP